MVRARRNRRRPPKRELPKLPRVPRPSVNWQGLVQAAAVVAVGAVSVALGRELLDLPVRQLDIEGRFQRVTKLEIRAAAQPALEQSFLTIDLADIHRRVAAIDWVDTVTLQRVWPDTLMISYSEHRAAARWGENGLLNVRGELFAEHVRHDYPELPQLIGPDGSHRRVAARYLDVRDRLTAAGLLLESIEMDARGAFSIRLDDGLEVRIGRDDIEGRINRFFDTAVPRLAADLARIDYLDMRYPKGFAVGWVDAETTEATLSRLENRG